MTYYSGPITYPYALFYDTQLTFPRSIVFTPDETDNQPLNIEYYCANRSNPRTTGCARPSATWPAGTRTGVSVTCRATSTRWTWVVCAFSKPLQQLWQHHLHQRQPGRCLQHVQRHLPARARTRSRPLRSPGAYPAAIQCVRSGRPAAPPALSCPGTRPHYTPNSGLVQERHRAQQLYLRPRMKPGQLHAEPGTWWAGPVRHTDDVMSTATSDITTISSALTACIPSGAPLHQPDLRQWHLCHLTGDTADCDPDRLGHARLISVDNRPDVGPAY